MPSILLLDDDPTALKFAAAVLSTHGLSVTACFEIEAAEALLREHTFEVVVTDLSVSELGGLEGMRLVRFAATHFPAVESYVLSAYIDDRTRNLALALGATGVFSKPMGLRELRDALRLKFADHPKGLERPPRFVEPLADFLASDRLHAVLQPIVRLSGEDEPCEVYGFEALNRGPSESMLSSPELLVRYASGKEMLAATDLSCVRSALREAAQLADPGTLCLNLQPRSLSAPGFAEQLESEVREAGLPPQDIVLELTEQQTILNSGAFADTLARLRETGFRIALDDFGEGYSNLDLFHQLRPEMVKISGYFCRDLARDASKQAVVRSLVELARSSGAGTLIEVVENADDARTAFELGVELGQGYLFSRPRRAEELALEAESGRFHPARLRLRPRSRAFAG